MRILLLYYPHYFNTPYHPGPTMSLRTSEPVNRGRLPRNFAILNERYAAKKFTQPNY